MRENTEMTAAEAATLRDMIQASIDAVLGAPPEDWTNRSYAVVEIAETEERVIGHRMYLVNADDRRLLELANEAKQEKNLEKAINCTALTSIPAITIRSLDLCGFEEAVSKASDMAITVSLGSHEVVNMRGEEKLGGKPAMHLVA